jgi:hypothetical protein
VLRFAFAALVLSARMAVAAEGPVPNFVPPTTRAVIGIHLRSVIDSGLLQSLGADLFKNAGASWTSNPQIAGINPLKDLDEVILVSTVEGDHPPTLIICRGRFAGKPLGRVTETYRGVSIRKMEDGNALVLLDGSTVLAGSLTDVREAIDRRTSQTGGLSPELAGRADELSQRYAIWGVGTLPEDFHPPAGGPEALNSLDRFDFGIAVRQGLELAATLHLRKPEDAQKLSAAMQFVEMMSKAKPSSDGMKLETHVENGTVTIAVTIPEEALKKAIQQQGAMIAQAIANQQGQKTRATAMPAAANPPAAPLAAAPAPPASKETKIVSDSDGTSVLVTLPGKR